MAKSLRAKSKQANRRKKRQDENSHYAAVEASRLQKVSDKLLGKHKEKAGQEGEGEGQGEGEGEGAGGEDVDVEEDDMGEGAKKISTSGPRQNRRQAWRESKGMDPRPKSTGQNKQLKQVAKRKAGRNKRRR